MLEYVIPLWDSTLTWLSSPAHLLLVWGIGTALVLVEMGREEADEGSCVAAGVFWPILLAALMLIGPFWLFYKLGTLLRSPDKKLPPGTDKDTPRHDH